MNKSLRVLVLGGTGFLGPHFVKAALDQGHNVAVFSRAETQKDLLESVERLKGDRTTNLDSIKNRDWDAVIDTAAFVPSWIRSLGEALRGRVGHYTFISTHAVYDNPGSNILTTEDSPVMKHEWSRDPHTLTTYDGFEEYSALKLQCEREVEHQFGESALIFRPCQIYGPGGFSLALFWMARMGFGGEMMVASELTSPMQFIDARDIAKWLILMIENKKAGIYNTLGPNSPIRLEDMLACISRIVGNTASLHCVSPQWLARRNEPTWKFLLFWENTAIPLMRMSAERAFSEGLRTRPMDITLSDSFHWYSERSAQEQQRVFLGAKHADGSPMTWQRYLEREKEALADWRAETSVISCAPLET